MFTLLENPEQQNSLGKEMVLRARELHTFKFPR